MFLEKLLLFQMVYIYIYIYMVSLWRRANARNVRLHYPYWQYTDLFIFRSCISNLPTQHTTFIYIYIHEEKTKKISAMTRRLYILWYKILVIYINFPFGFLIQNHLISAFGFSMNIERLHTFGSPFASCCIGYTISCLRLELVYLIQHGR